jgi:protein-L-isoaspartate(D-aspartate) O-methyltransferase
MNAIVTLADSAARRRKMVDGQIRTTGVTGAALLEALLEVPREAFVPAARRDLAYIDEDVLIAGDGGAGSRWLMEASPFARLVQLAALRPGDKVLDVGTGTGYPAAVLSRLAGRVTALESDPGLAETARAALAGLGAANVEVVTGDLPRGFAANAPYDVIIIEGSIAELPSLLPVQLTEGGRLVAVEGVGNAGVARFYLKSGGVVSGRGAFNAAVKPLPGFESAPAFEF